MIIVGAGIIGLSCAWRLAQAGVPVTIFDSGECGGEASGAAAGMLAPGGEFETPTPLAEMAWRSLAQYPAFVSELQKESGMAIDFRACGAIDLKRPGERRFFPADAVVNPRDVVRALVTACRARGVKISEHEPVGDIGQFHGDVLVAAGAWSSSLVPGPPRTFPVRGHLIGYNLAPGFLPTILRDRDTYLLQRSSGLLIAGSTTEHVGFDRNVDPAIVEDLHRRACQLIPALKSRQPDESWIGFRPAIEAEAPRIGRIDGTRIWTAFGHYRNGILLAPETARLIASAITL